MNDLVSIIIPVYNVELYLKSCLDSLLTQTYNNFEIIIVDDGSFDKSSSICLEYSKKDKRIKFINSKHIGVSNARNIGLEYANGKYISFVDPDDTLSPDYLRVLCSQIEIHNADVVGCSRKKVTGHNNLFIVETVQNNKFISFNNEEALIKLFTLKDYMGVAGKIYKRSIINNHKFNNLETGEDLEFNSRIFLNISKMIWCDTELYFYLQRDSSLTHKKDNKLRISEFISVWMSLQNIPKENVLCRAHALERLMKIYLYLRYNEKTRFIEEIYPYVNTYFSLAVKEFNINNEIPKLKKILINISIKNPVFYSLCRKTASLLSRLYNVLI